MSARRHAAALLVVDLGNTKTECVLYEGKRVRGRWRLDPPFTTGHAVRRGMRAVTASVAALGAAAARVVVGSVVAARTRSCLRVLQDHHRGPIHVVSWQDPWPFEIAVRRPETVGVDRLLNVAGLVALGLRRGIAVDAGTAVTIDVLRAGRFEGGAILPGMGLAAAALHTGTAQLPRVDVEARPDLLGRDTRAAIHAGVYHGTGYAVAGLTAALGRGLGRYAVRVTGGAAEAVLPYLGRRARWQPDLAGRGALLLAARLRWH